MGDNIFNNPQARGNIRNGSSDVPFDWAKAGGRLAEENGELVSSSEVASDEMDLDSIIAEFSGSKKVEPQQVQQPQVQPPQQTVGVFRDYEFKRPAPVQQEKVQSEPRRQEQAPHASRQQQAAVDYEEMKQKSTTSAPSSNKREKANVMPEWLKRVISKVATVAIIAGIGVGIGTVVAEPIDNMISDLDNRWELHNRTSSFVEEVIEPNTVSTFTQDQSIDYGKIAQAIESDGQFTNEELLVTVDALGEVQANRVLDAAINPPAADVETYMRDHNISSVGDWKEKTARAMSINDDISESKAELDAIFRDAASSEAVTTNENTTSGTYGGK